MRTKWVAPHKVPEHVGPDTLGWVDEGVIYLVKGKTTPWTKAHEEAHIRLGHLPKELNPNEYVGEELDANLLTYEELRKPRRLIMELRGILHELIYNWGLKPKQGLRAIKRELEIRGGIPRAWYRDFKRLEREHG